MRHPSGKTITNFEIYFGAMHLIPLEVSWSRRLPLLLAKEERAGERRRVYSELPSLRLSPHSFLAGRESANIVVTPKPSFSGGQGNKVHSPIYFLGWVFISA